MEENQNLTQGTQSQWQVGFSLKDWATSLNNTQNVLRKAKQSQSINDDTASITHLAASSINSDDKEITRKSNKAIRETQVARWIKDYYSRIYPEELDKMGINFDDWWGAEDTIKWYLSANPSSTQYLKKYITSDDTKNDPMDLYYTMWWLPSKDEEIVNRGMNAIDAWVWETSKNFMSWIDESAIWLRNFYNWIEWIWNKDALYFWALENYAHEVLGKDTTQLTDLEIYWIQEALKDEETFKMFEPTPQKAVTKTAAWFTDALFTIAAPWAKYIMSLLAATPWTDKWMELVWRTQIWIWQVVNGLIPPLRAYRSTLTDIDKMEFDAWVWSLVTMWALKKYWGKIKYVTKEAYTDLINKIWQKKIISKFLAIKPQNNLPTASDLNNIKDTTTQEMYNQAAKIWDTTRTYENPKVSSALSQIDPQELRWTRSYSDLNDLVRKSIDTRARLQDSILDTFERFVGKDNGRIGWGANLEYDVSVENYDEPIQEWIDYMREMNPDWKTRNVTDAVSQWYNKWKLSVSKIKKLVRAMNAQSRNFKKWLEWQELKNHTSKVNRITQQLNQLVKEWLNNEPAFKELWLDNVVEYLDKQESDLLYTRDLISNILNKLNSYEADIPNTNILKKTSKLLNIFRSLKSPSSAVNELWELWGPEKFNPKYRQSELNSMLNKWADLNETLEKYKTPEEIQKALDKFNEQYQKDFWDVNEWPIEWEVIDPSEWEKRDIYDSNKYLDDIIKVEHPEDFMLPEDQRYNWQDWIDYTSPTRVTPEGYAWRYWQTLESWKNMFRQAWLSPEKVDLVVDTLQKNWFKLKSAARWLFDDLPWDLETEILWEEMAKAKAKAKEEFDNKVNRKEAKNKAKDEAKNESEDLKKKVKK